MTPIISEDHAFLTELRFTVGDERIPIVLGDLLSELKVDKIDGIVNELVGVSDLSRAVNSMRDHLEEFLDAKKSKCLYWSLPKMYRLRYDELIRPSFAGVSMKLPDKSHEWGIPQEGKCLGVLSNFNQSIAGECIPLQGPYVACGDLVFDLDNKCSILMKSDPEFTHSKAHHFYLLFPGSRAVVHSMLETSSTEIITLHNGESEPVQYRISHDYLVRGSPRSLKGYQRGIYEAPLRIVFKPPFFDGRYQIINIESNSVEYTHDANAIDEIKKSTLEGFVKNKQCYSFLALPKTNETLVFGNGKVLIVFLKKKHGVFEMAVYSYQEWEELPIQERFVKYENVRLPNLYLKHAIVAEVEQVASFISLKKPSHRYPRIFRDGRSGWVNREDIVDFEEFKERIDAYVESESFKMLIAQYWEQGNHWPALPLDDLLVSLELTPLDFLTLFLSKIDFNTFRTYFVDAFEMNIGSIRDNIVNPFNRHQSMPITEPALDIIFKFAGLKRATTMQQLKGILNKYC